jgi:hypothetical protein
MCTAGSALAGDAPFAGASDALRAPGAALDYVNSAEAARVGSFCGELLIALGEIQAKLTAAHAAVLRRFDAADAHDTDGYGSSSSWLAARAGMSRQGARAAVRQMPRGRPGGQDVTAPSLATNLYKFWYTIGMASPELIQVHPLSEVRARLSGILARFRREGAAAEPIAFGSHRKPEAILIPYEAYERYEALARQRARLDSALSAAQSVQVELPGAFSPEHDREVSAYVDGEMSAAELYRRTVSRYRRP